MSPPGTRYLELDLLRTVAIVGMVVYHTTFDLAVFHGVQLDPFSGGFHVLQQVTANLFLLLVGMGFAISYGRMRAAKAGMREIAGKYLRRAAAILLCALLVSAVTRIAVGGQYVRFGILHLIGAATLLLPLLMWLEEGTALVALAVIALSPLIRSLPAASPLLLPLGISRPGFATIDYFPLFPWFASMLLGAAIGHFFYVRAALTLHLVDRPWTRRLTAPGRHALVIYLLHQPVILGVLWVILR